MIDYIVFNYRRLQNKFVRNRIFELLHYMSFILMMLSMSIGLFEPLLFITFLIIFMTFSLYRIIKWLVFLIVDDYKLFKRHGYNIF